MILKVEKHLSNTAKSEVWFKESRELRNWVALRAKFQAGVVGESKAGDRATPPRASFAGQTGEPLEEFRFKVYERLPAERCSRRAGAHLLINQMLPSQALKTEPVRASVPELCP